MGRNEPKIVENRQQESYQVTHWIKRMEPCRTVWSVVERSRKYKTESQDTERRLIYTPYKWTKY